MQMNNLFFLDIETGGFSKSRDAICSISLKYGDDMRTWFIKPYGKRYTKKALEVHKITLEELYEKGIEVKQVIKKIIAFIIYHNKDDNMFVGHNLHFDLGFLESLFDENGCSLYDNITYHYLDTMNTAIYLKKLGKINPKSLKLIDLYKLFYDDGLEEDAHRSDIDVLMTEKVYNKLLEIENGKNINNKNKSN